MDKIAKCSKHGRVTEIYCKTCKAYICLECLSFHQDDCPKAQFVHIFKRAEDFAVPALQERIDKLGGTDQEYFKECERLMSHLGEIVPELKRMSLEHLQATQVLKNLVVQLEAQAMPRSHQPISEQMRRGLTADKHRLERALEDDNLETLITLTKKILGESEVSAKKDLEQEVLDKIKSLLGVSPYMMTYKGLIDALTVINAKYQRLQYSGYITDWKCDRKYFSTKMTLSEDGLVFGNSAGNGYPAIVGDTPIEGGVCLFTVIPEGLNCTGKEGFGIIDIEKYKTCFTADPTTPTVHDYMIGYFYSDNVKSMTTVRSNTMQMGQKYYVKVDTSNLKMEIKGPGLYLTAELKPEVVYVPCFSCGCTGNKLTIKPLSVESEELMEQAN